MCNEGLSEGLNETNLKFLGQTLQTKQLRFLYPGQVEIAKVQKPTELRCTTALIYVPPTLAIPSQLLTQDLVRSYLEII